VPRLSELEGVREFDWELKDVCATAERSPLSSGFNVCVAAGCEPNVEVT